jgi:hypothetical protein
MRRTRSLRLALEAGAIALVVKVGLRVCSFATVDAGLETLGARYRTRWPDDFDPEEVYRVGTRAVAVLPGRDTCLVRSLTCRTLLRWYSHRTELRFGVKRVADTGDLHAHAWLERPDGTTFVPGETEEFVQLRSGA